MPSYRVKVFGRIFLWGGAEVRTHLDSDLMLSFRVADEGEPVRIGVMKVGPSRDIELGRLERGESYTVPLRGLSGVYAVCMDDTYVECQIHAAEDASKPALGGVPGL